MTDAQARKNFGKPRRKSIIIKAIIDKYDSIQNQKLKDTIGLTSFILAACVVVYLGSAAALFLKWAIINFLNLAFFFLEMLKPVIYQLSLIHTIIAWLLRVISAALVYFFAVAFLIYQTSKYFRNNHVVQKSVLREERE